MSIYLHANKQGSITEATDPSGQVVERYRYDEFGKVTVLGAAFNVLSAAVVGNWFLFTGREYDWETGYYHYRARTCDPGTGTFLQEDPLGLHDGMNVVAYVHGDPVNFGDPFGTAGIGEMVESIMAFINENREIIGVSRTRRRSSRTPCCMVSQGSALLFRRSGSTKGLRGHQRTSHSAEGPENR